MGREPYPVGGRVRRVTIRAARPACSRMPANCVMKKGSDGGSLATPGGGVGSCGVDVRPPSDSEIPNKKPATDFSVRALQFSR